MFQFCVILLVDPTHPSHERRLARERDSVKAGSLVAGAVSSVVACGLWRRCRVGELVRLRSYVIRRSSSAAGTMVRDMSKKSDAAVGRLAIMDGALNGLLRDLVTETVGADATSLTTGKAAQALLRDLKHDPALFTTDVRDWLSRVIQAAEARNKVMHAIAQDQCVICGDATQFDHRGKPVDRSAAAVTAVSADFKSLIDEGVRHARDISHTLNARARAAVKDAADTDAVQGPKQVLTGRPYTAARNAALAVSRSLS
jgi:hypothetical protein